MSTIKFTLNGKECFAEDGEYLLGAAKKNGIEIPSLCDHPSVKVYGACGLCTVEVEGIPKLLRACSTKVTDGMVVNSETDRVKHSRKIALELLMSDHDGDCVGPCSLNCPAGTDCQGYVKAIAGGDYHGAIKIIKDKLPLPASIGRICPHPCEKKCRRQYVESPISIAALKAFAADRDLESDTYVDTPAAPTGKRVSIIGGGPAGLTTAYYLALRGHSVTVYDAMPKMGGMLRYGIPAYRLPKSVLDAEIKLIGNVGVEFKNNIKIGRDIDFNEIKNSSDATIIAVGAWKSSSMRVPGEELIGVIGGIDFLRAVSFFNSGDGDAPVIGDKVVICGGGNTAMDACRTAIRLGAKEVSVVYRRTRAEMPAELEEIEEAEEEGVVFRFLRNPAEFVGENGKLSAVKLQVMELGEPDASGRRSPIPVEGSFELLKADTVIEAIGQSLDFSGIEGLEYNRRGNIVADESSFATSIEGVFAVGDATNRGAGIAISAIGEANKAAAVVDSYLNGDIISYKNSFISERALDAIDFSVYNKATRIDIPKRSADVRRNDFDAVNLELDEAAVRAEASRCLECGCHDYADCRLIRNANLLPIEPARLAGQKHLHETERQLVSIERNSSKCILCSLCVRTCNEVAKKSILGLVGRGFNTVIRPEFNYPETISVCRDCHLCFDVCPTGALKLIKD